MAFVYENNRFKDNLFGSNACNNSPLNTPLAVEEYKEIENIKKNRSKKALKLKIKKAKAVPFGISVARDTPKEQSNHNRMYSIPTNRNPPIIVYMKPTASFASNCNRFKKVRDPKYKTKIGPGSYKQPSFVD